jgi:hypothetical protein
VVWEFRRDIQRCQRCRRVHPRRFCLSRGALRADAKFPLFSIKRGSSRADSAWALCVSARNNILENQI